MLGGLNRIVMGESVLYSNSSTMSECGEGLNLIVMGELYWGSIILGCHSTNSLSEGGRVKLNCVWGGRQVAEFQVRIP